tara:strand:+ start:102 stop:674 length:573 start_codon:yes stop_codon:yes gene_type:complete
MTNTITNEQWAKIDKKYAKLMMKISHQISGDAATAQFDDNLQDIRLSAMEAVMGFEKQNEGANGTFDQFWGTKGFDQYIKTCMWTKKNNKGAKITKKAAILKGTVSTDKEEILEMEECTGDPEVAMMLEEISYLLNPTQKAIVSMVVKDPTLIKPSGKINVAQIAETMNSTWFETDKQIKALSNLLENEL